MSDVGHWVRMHGIARLLEVTQNSLKNALRTGEAAMSNEDHAAFADRCSEWSKHIIENDTANQEAHRALRKYQDAIVAVPIPGDDARLFCRCDDKGEIVIEAFAEGLKYEIKVLESIETCHQNLFDPIVQWAINRAQTGKLWDGQPTAKFLKKLPNALAKGLKKGTEQNPTVRLFKLLPASREYCEGALEEIRKIWIGDADREGQAQITDEQIESLKSAMDTRFPEQDHIKLIEFIQKGRLPNSRQLKAFVNAFNCFLFNPKKTSAVHKVDVSKARRKVLKMGEWRPLPESKAQNLDEDFLYEMFGLNVIATSRQIKGSALCWREIAMEEWMNTSPENEAAPQSNRKSKTLEKR